MAYCFLIYSSASLCEDIRDLSQTVSLTTANAGDVSIASFQVYASHDNCAVPTMIIENVRNATADSSKPVLTVFRVSSGCISEHTALLL